MSRRWPTKTNGEVDELRLQNRRRYRPFAVSVESQRRRKTVETLRRQVRAVTLSLLSRYTTLRSRILERVRKVNEMTETAALQAGNSLDQVVATARTHIAHLGAFLVKSTDSALQRAIADHAAQRASARRDTSKRG